MTHFLTNQQRSFVCGPDADGDIVITNSEGVFFLASQNNWKITPLCWVEGKPVYPDSVLYGKHTGQQYLGKDIGDTSAYIWQKLKQKKTGWINIYRPIWDEVIARPVGIYSTKEKADAFADTHRVACSQIEWEE